MKNLHILDNYRKPLFGFWGDEKKGKFYIPMHGIKYQILASSGEGFDHVSVSVIYEEHGEEKMRIATYQEMEEIKNLFFEANEQVMEIHPAKKDYVNMNEYVLHMWRPNTKDLPLPPVIRNVKDYDVIPLDKPNHFLKISVAIENGWECYEVQVMKNDKFLKRYPSWNEMCIAKKYVCGEDVVAFEFHERETTYQNSIRFWIAPKDLEMPLPSSLMVGIRENNKEEDIKMLIKKIFSYN